MARYKDAVRWIAWNDETTEDCDEVLSSLVSVCLIADIWGKTTATVALDVLRVREREGIIPRLYGDKR